MCRETICAYVLIKGLDFKDRTFVFYHVGLTLDRPRILEMLSPWGWMSQHFQSELKAKRIPGELLVFSLRLNPEELGSNIGEGCHSMIDSKRWNHVKYCARELSILPLCVLRSNHWTRSTRSMEFGKCLMTISYGVEIVSCSVNSPFQTFHFLISKVYYFKSGVFIPREN